MSDGMVRQLRSRRSSPPSACGDKDADESPISEDGDVGQDANCTRDFAPRAQRKNPDANADAPQGRQQPHAREIRSQRGREIVRVRKDSANRANERNDPGRYRPSFCLPSILGWHLCLYPLSRPFGKAKHGDFECYCDLSPIAPGVPNSRRLTGLGKGQRENRSAYPLPCRIFVASRICTSSRIALFLFLALP